MLPYDVGATDYGLKKHWRENPYTESDWRHDEWQLGWAHRRESDADGWDYATDTFVTLDPRSSGSVSANSR